MAMTSEMEVITREFLNKWGTWGIADISTSRAFHAHWWGGYDIVRIRDHMSPIEFVDSGDIFCPKTNPDIPPSILRDQRRAAINKAATYGLWGYGLARYYQPMYETFTWGFVGDEVDSYAGDLLYALESRGTV